MTRHRALSALSVGVAFLVAVSVASPPRASQAVFTDSADVGTNTFTSGEWAVYYLHDNPTPPTADTNSQANLPMDMSAPSATTLFNYDTDCDGRVGRTLRRGSGAVGESGVCAYATWHGPIYGSPRFLGGTMTVDIYARKSANGGQNPTLHVFLREYQPSTGTYTEVASGSSAVATQATQAFAAYTFNLAVNHTFDAGSLIELKLTATGTNRDIDIAYDTVAYPSRVTLP